MNKYWLLAITSVIYLSSTKILAYVEQVKAIDVSPIEQRATEKPKNNLRKNLLIDARLQKSTSDEACVAGQAGDFPCNNIDLLAHIALSDFSTNPSAANDIWGHYDLNTGKEYALIGLENGIGIVDVSKPAAPTIITTISSPSTIWRDIKVYQKFSSAENRWKSYAYVTADNLSIGMLIIDLSGLPTSATVVATDITDVSAHNVYISNVDYSTGVSLSGTSPYLHIVGSARNFNSFNTYSLSNPTSLTTVFNPTSSTPGSTHDISSMVITDARKDTQCVNGGQNCEILFDFNGRSNLKIWDKTNNANPQLLSSTAYTNLSLAHAGWYTEDKQVLIVHDELDELNVGLNTTVRFFDISDLTSPSLIATWTGPTPAIDHNGFVRGNRYYMSNYERGLTILDISNPASPVEVGFFDTFPASDTAKFGGAWGIYPFLPSGNLLVSDFDSGLYILKNNTLTSPNGSFKFSESSYTTEEDAFATITVDRINGNTGAVQVGWELIPGSADSSDYAEASGILEWTTGDSESKDLNVVIIGDAVDENTEAFFIRLFDPRNGATLAVPNLAKISITDVLINLAPTVDAGAAASGLEGTQITLTATANDPEDDPLTFVWSQTSGATVTLSSTDTLSTNFTPATEGVYQFQFEATDVGGKSSSDTVDVSISKPTPPPVPPTNSGGGSLGNLFALFCFLGFVRFRKIRIIPAYQILLGDSLRSFESRLTTPGFLPNCFKNAREKAASD